MALPSIPGVASNAMNSLLRAGLAKPVNTFNDFLGSINQRIIQQPLLGINKRLLSASNPYASQNAWAKVKARPDPLMDFDWIAAVISPTPEIGWEYIDTFTAPSIDYNIHESPHNHLTRKTIGQRTVGDITIGLYPDNLGQTMNWAVQWQRSALRSDGFFNLPATYQKDIVLFILDAKRNTVIDFRFVNCTPRSDGSMDFGAGQGLVSKQLTLSCEDVLVSSEDDLSMAAQRIGTMIPQFPQTIGSGGLFRG